MALARLPHPARQSTRIPKSITGSRPPTARFRNASIAPALPLAPPPGPTNTTSPGAKALPGRARWQRDAHPLGGSLERISALAHGTLPRRRKRISCGAHGEPPAHETASACRPWGLPRRPKRPISSGALGASQAGEYAPFPPPRKGPRRASFERFEPPKKAPVSSEVAPDASARGRCRWKKRFPSENTDRTILRTGSPPPGPRER